MTKCFLIRHGQTVWNREYKYQGHTDKELDETGIHQARQLAARLAEQHFDAIYSSDLSRAYMTAKLVSEGRGLSISKIKGLREMCFGEWEGQTFRSIEKKCPELVHELYSKPRDVQIPGGESFLEVQKRALVSIKELVMRHPGETLAVVTHGGTIRAILCEALHMNLDYVWNIRMDNTSVTVIDYEGETGIVGLVNDAHHLTFSLPVQ